MALPIVQIFASSILDSKIKRAVSSFASGQNYSILKASIGFSAAARRAGT